ncbi:PorV/PorQ family protein [Gracilimonas mengyeensis]|uniref:Type IX secretion system protein PorV domain-containing protein n=1 Tax=Gracilimonas mengyeensis TaxID=1302730 RepID=A0A521EK99_9BACT|nr:PorV/PorQ family protein [Gracilimonas mengyeensis]SMO83891.1 hypothetical protein SAMN06265219_11277 [Gracilimonas mengyeensis]
MTNSIYKFLVIAVGLQMLFVFAPQKAQSQGLIPSFGDARSGTSGFQFVKIAVDPRSTGMGMSNVADIKDASSLYWNPALASQAQNSEFMISHTQYFADISMEYLGYIQRYKSFTFGGSIQYLNSGEMEETTEFAQRGTGRMFRTIHISAGVTASHKITDLFSYGLTVKYLSERLEEVEINTAAIDFGFFYMVGETGLRFSVGLNNFGLDATPSGETTRPALEGETTETEFEDTPLPTRFIIATAYDVYKNESLKAVLTAQITNPSDNAEQFSVGGELTFLDQFFVRTGYQFAYKEVQLPSLGAGVKVPIGNKDLHADYSFSTYDRLGTLHRIGLRFSL